MPEDCACTHAHTRTRAHTNTHMHTHAYTDKKEYDMVKCHAGAVAQAIRYSNHIQLSSIFPCLRHVFLCKVFLCKVFLCEVFLCKVFCARFFSVQGAKMCTNCFARIHERREEVGNQSPLRPSLSCWPTPNRCACGVNNVLTSQQH